MEMKFQEDLLKVTEWLSQEEETALGFLCIDECRPLVKSAKDLFIALMRKDLLSADKPELVIDLLVTIGRQDVVQRVLRLYSRKDVSSRVPRYRKLLYNLSEEISTRDLDTIKFLLNESIPKGKLEAVSTLQVFLEMEQREVISETNLDRLEGILKLVCPKLNQRIKCYKEEISTERTRSSSFSECRKDPIPFNRNVSLKDSRSQSLESSNNNLEQVPTIRSPDEEQSEVLEMYPMTSAKRGICVIINNSQFKCPLKNRMGTDVDERSLKLVFEWLGFEVQIHQNCDCTMMSSVLSDLGKTNHSQMDCLVCCILSHGIESKVYGVDGSSLPIKDLMSFFEGMNCRTLLEKPKLFFIQACQGKDQQIGIQADGDDETGELASDAVRIKDAVPSAADFLLGMATVPTFVSYRHTTEGSWYIQTLCQNLIKLVPHKVDLVSILTKVNADVSKKTDVHCIKKQMPQPSFSLRKRVVFPVPENPPPDLSAEGKI